MGRLGLLRGGHMIRAGELRECVQLFRVSTSNDATVGELVETPTCYATKRAKVTPSASQESEIAAGRQARTSYDVLMRISRDIKHTDQIEWRGVRMEIASGLLHDGIEQTTRFVAQVIEVDEPVDVYEPEYPPEETENTLNEDELRALLGALAN